MKKRILSLMLASAVALSMGACGAKKPAETEPASQTQTEASSEAEKAPETEQAAQSTEKSFASSKLGYTVSEPVVDGNTITVDVLTADGRETVAVSIDDEKIFKEKTMKGSDQIIDNQFITIDYDESGKAVDCGAIFTSFLTKYNVYFDTIKYGAEFHRNNGVTGNAIASGWLLEKDGATIRVGDTNKFEEVYNLDANVKVFNVDMEAKTIKQITLDDVPATEKTNGYWSMTNLRTSVIAVFDQNFEKADEAKVTELYYLTPAKEIEPKYLVEAYDTMSQYSSYGDYDADGDGTGGTTKSIWNMYTKPFVIYPDKLISVSDTDLFMMLVLGGNNEMWLLDAGNFGDAYNLFLTMEEAGYDPRELTGVMNTHGHGDHFGALAEYQRMMAGVGKDLYVYASYEDTYGLADQGWADIGPVLNDETVRLETDATYVWGEYMDLGNNIRVLPIKAPGHTEGSGSFVFECTGDDGKAVTFGYVGGMGTNCKDGAPRLEFEFMLRYLEQTQVCDYQLPQHCGHFNILEINKAGEAAGLTFMEAEVQGYDSWMNYLESRMELIDIAYYRQWLFENADPEQVATIDLPDGTTTVASAGFGYSPKREQTLELADGTTTTKNMYTGNPPLVTIEEKGPYKREAGEYEITILDTPKVIKGYSALVNANPLFKGVTNLAGEDMSNGIIQCRDGYIHDPNRWFIQASMKVNDDYDGQLTTLTAEEGNNGPVERAILGDDWYEINRTLAFRDEALANQIMSTLEVGKTYKVKLDKCSNIIIADDPAETFVPVN